MAQALVVQLDDTPVLRTGAFSDVGSNPTGGTMEDILDPLDALEEWVENVVFTQNDHKKATLDRLAHLANKDLNLNYFTSKEVGQAMIGICRRKNYDIISYPFNTDD